MFATSCRATRAQKEIWECRVPQGTKVQLVYQACRWEIERCNNLSTIFTSNTPVSWILSCPPLGYKWGQRWQRRPRSSRPSGSISELQRWHSHKHDFQDTLGGLGRLGERGGVMMLLMMVQHLLLIIADNWPARTTRATWPSRTNGKWFMDSSRNHKTHWFSVVKCSFRSSFLYKNNQYCL